MTTEIFTLKVENIYKTFKTVNALNGISLDFSAGFMHGIIGPEGAGKTTLMRIILGLLKQSAGEVTYYRDNQAIDFKNIREDVAYMPQQESLYADLSVKEHLEFFKDLYEIPVDLYKTKSSELLHISRLTEFIDRPAGQLSGGMYKKLGLICALLRSPRIMLLDEPTNGVDPISRRELWDLLYRMADQHVLIIVTTAYMDEAERCSYVHLLDNGSVVGSGEPRKVLEAAHVNNFDTYFMQRGQS